MPSYTIIEEGHYYKLQQDGKTVAAISDCEEPVAKRIAMHLNRAAYAYSEINKFKQQRDELLAALKKVNMHAGYIIQHSVKIVDGSGPRPMLESGELEWTINEIGSASSAAIAKAEGGES